MSLTDKISALVDARFEEEVGFVAELVRTPSDNPPGDCAAHAEVTAKALERLGFAVSRHPVPRSEEHTAELQSH